MATTTPSPLPSPLTAAASVAPGDSVSSTSPLAPGTPIVSAFRVSPAMRPCASPPGFIAAATPPLGPAAVASDAAAAAAGQRMSPVPTIPVPLITPKYQKKTRSKNHMEITDSTSSEENTFSATELLRQRSVEALNIKHGCATYDEHVRFHAYALYRHGARAIVSHSIGYSSEGDLVLQRQDVSESESDMSAKRVFSEVGGAVCLDPSARRPLTDTELASARRVNPSRLKKYPGVRCPKNRKIRNRLRNDHFADPFARKLLEATCEASDSDDEPRPVFGNVPSTFAELLHKDEEQQMQILEKKGISPILRPMSSAPSDADPNSAEARLSQVSTKLKSELRRALGSEVLTALISQLEQQFTSYITRALSNGSHAPSAVKPLSIEGLDGYGRLICHGVAAFYKLNSQSVDSKEGERVTQVSLPKRLDGFHLPGGSLLDCLRRRGSGGGSGAGGGALANGASASGHLSRETPAASAPMNAHKLKKKKKSGPRVAHDDVAAEAGDVPSLALDGFTLDGDVMCVAGLSAAKRTRRGHRR